MTSLDESAVRALMARAVPERAQLEPNWANVLARASDGTVSSRTRRHLSRHLPPRLFAAVALVGAAALAGGTLAFGTAVGWWFTSSGALQPAGEVVTVQTGTWKGTPWAFTAYRAQSGEVCVGVTPNETTNPTGVGAAVNCVAPDSLGTAPVSLLASEATATLPGYVAGLVPSSATGVQISLANGASVSAHVAAGSQVDSGISFYIAELPCGAELSRLVAVDASGSRVASEDLSSVHLQPGRDSPCP